MKQKNIPRKRVILYTAELVITGVLLCGFIVDFNRKLNKTFEDSAIERLKEVNNQSNNSLNLMMKSSKDDLTFLAENLNDILEASGGELELTLNENKDAVVGMSETYKECLDYLNSYIGNTDFTRMRIVLINDTDTNGWTVSTDGYSGLVPDSETTINIKNLDWFKDASLGNAGVSSVLKSTIEDNPYFFTIYNPIYDSNHKLVAAVNGLYYTQSFSKVYDFYSFEGKGFSDIIQKNGDFVYVSANPNSTASGDNLFKVLDTYEETDTSLNEVTKNISENKDFMVTYGSRKNARYFYFSHCDFNDWYIVTVVPYGSLETYSSSVINHEIIFITEIVLVFLLVMLLTSVYVYNTHNKEIENIELANLESQKRSALLNYTNTGCFEFDVINKKLTFKTVIPTMKSKITDTFTSIDDFAENTIKFVADVTAYKEMANKVLNGKKVESGIFVNILNYYQRHTLTAIYDDKGKLVTIVGVIQDVTAEKNLEEELRDKANHDKLTNVLNRAGFDNEYAKALDNDKEKYLVMSDIDGFKSINDMFGHVQGDKVLADYATILSDQIKQNSIVARFGGDEFMVILVDYTKEEVYEYCNRVQQEFKKTNSVIKPTCSIGITKITKNDGFSICYKKVDNALYKAKESQNGHIVYGD